MNSNETRGQLVTHALSGCPPLAHRSVARDALWLVVKEQICTRGLCFVTPLGSSSPVPVTAEHATQELLAAMDWLATHEQEARSLDPLALFIKLRGVATKGAAGSARAAQTDALHGMTQVSPGDPVTFTDIDPIEAAS